MLAAVQSPTTTMSSALPNRLSRYALAYEKERLRGADLEHLVHRIKDRTEYANDGYVKKPQKLVSNFWGAVHWRVDVFVGTVCE